MLYIIKCVILMLVVIAGFAVAAGWVLGRFDEDEDEQCMCAITGKHCKYDYSVYAGGNPCDQCDIFKEWEDELNGKL